MCSAADTRGLAYVEDSIAKRPDKVGHNLAFLDAYAAKKRGVRFLDLCCHIVVKYYIVLETQARRLYHCPVPKKLKMSGS